MFFNYYEIQPISNLFHQYVMENLAKLLRGIECVLLSAWLAVSTRSMYWH